jgi:hypothetical protein
MENYFVERLKPGKNSGKTVFDGWPATYNI